MNLKSKIIADDGTIFYIRYTGTFQLGPNLSPNGSLIYPFVSLLATMTISTETNNTKYHIITEKKYLGVGEINLLTHEVSYNLYPVP